MTTSGPLCRGKALKKCTVKAVYINLLEAIRGVRANPLEPPAYGPDVPWVYWCQGFLITRTCNKGAVV